MVSCPFTSAKSNSGNRNCCSKISRVLIRKGSAILFASKKSINSLVNFLESLLERKNFFHLKEKKKSMILNINNIFARLELSDKEIRILSSIFGSLSKNKKH